MLALDLARPEKDNNGHHIPHFNAMPLPDKKIPGEDRTPKAHCEYFEHPKDVVIPTDKTPKGAHAKSDHGDGITSHADHAVPNT